MLGYNKKIHLDGDEKVFLKIARTRKYLDRAEILLSFGFFVCVYVSVQGQWAQKEEMRQK
jgi:hypothetical protein